MSSCSIKGCGKNKRTSNYKTDGITFHRFPKNPETKKIWIEATRRNRDWVPTKSSVICSRHFAGDCYIMMENQRRLFNSAIPTLFLPLLNSAADGETANLNTLKQKDVDKEYEPDAYTSLTEKRFCRRILDLTAKNKNSNIIIKKLRDANRNLKKKLASLFDELEDKISKTDKNTSLLDSIGAKCQEIRQKLKRRSVSSDDLRSEDELHEPLSSDDDSSERTQHTSIAKNEEKGSCHEGCYCNECSDEISGFRYICVQCTDFNLCSACEAKGLHGLHYMLRVPECRPSEEITSMLENFRGALFKHGGNVETIEITIKEEPDPLGIGEKVYINTVISADNQLMQKTSRVTTSEAAIRDDNHNTSDIPNKKRRMEMEEFLSFKSDSSHRTAPPQNLPLSTENIVGFVTTSNIKDIKIEPDISEEAKCDVFVHKDSGQFFSGSTTMEGLSDSGTKHRATIVPLLAGSYLSTASASDVTTRGARPVLCIEPLEPSTAAMQTQLGSALDAQLSCQTFVDVAGTNSHRPK